MELLIAVVAAVAPTIAAGAAWHNARQTNHAVNRRVKGAPTISQDVRSLTAGLEEVRGSVRSMGTDIGILKRSCTHIYDLIDGLHPEKATGSRPPCSDWTPCVEEAGCSCLEGRV